MGVNMQGVESIETGIVQNLCDLNMGDLVRLRVLEGEYTTFNKIPEEKYVESEWRPRGPKFRAGVSCFVVDTGWGHEHHWVKVIIPGEGQGWIKREFVQVIE
jgi:hypothetical protein